MPKSWLILLCFAASSCAALASPSISELATSTEWLRLLHMEPRTFGSGYQSTSERSAFFITDQNRDPKLELEATLQAFTSTQADNDKNAQCLFPARKIFLEKLLTLKFGQTPKCTAYQNFRRQIDAHAVSVVFSSYYLNNPSSAFGHTFLRFSRNPATLKSLHPSERYELLDTGISFGANPTTHNPLLYLYDGAFGNFNGTWTSLPYYYKVYEYNNADSRDLWSYDLNLNQEQIDILIAHLWELGHARFPYYYFTKNCSYHILSALEVADSKIDLLKHLRTQTIPVDTIKALYRTPGFVTGVSYRPSIRALLVDRYQKTQNPELALKTVRDRNLQSLPSEEHARAQILDLAIDKIEFDSRNDPRNKLDPFKQKLFLERSHLSLTTAKQTLTPDPSEAPQNAHGSRLLGAFGGTNSTTLGFGELHYRFALHSFIDPSAGYPDFAELEMLSLTGRFDWSAHHFELERAKLFQVTSLSGWNALFKPISWELSLGTTTVRDDRCANCFAAELTGGAGVTIAQGKYLITALLAKVQALESDSFDGGFFQLATGPEFKAIVRAGARMQFVLQGEYLYNLRGGFSYDWLNSLEAQFNLNRSLALRLSGSTLINKMHGDETESKLGMLYYF